MKDLSMYLFWNIEIRPHDFNDRIIGKHTSQQPGPEPAWIVGHKQQTMNAFDRIRFGCDRRTTGNGWSGFFSFRN